MTEDINRNDNNNGTPRTLDENELLRKLRAIGTDLWRES